MLDFLAYLEFERGLSRNTLEAYRSDLLQFGAWLRRTGRDPLRVDARRARRRSSPSSPRARGQAARQARRRCSARSPACAPSTAICAAQGLIEDDPTAQLKAPRERRKLPQVLTRDEVARLLAQPDGAEPAALRDRALLELMYACGLRASEAIELELSDLDLDAARPARPRQGQQGAPRARRHRGRARARRLPGRGRPRLVGERLEPRLFVNHRGSGLTRQGLYKIVQRHARAAGLASR